MSHTTYGAAAAPSARPENEISRQLEYMAELVNRIDSARERLRSLVDSIVGAAPTPITGNEQIKAIPANYASGLIAFDASINGLFEELNRL